MQYQKCSLDLYLDFLLASQRQYSGAELSAAAPFSMAHDSVNRWLAQEKLSPRMLWTESKCLVDRTSGYLILDDSVLDKPYSRKLPLAKAQYSGKHHRVVRGIDSVNLLWTDGGAHPRLIPVDYRLYHIEGDGKTKNDHAREMLALAQKRGFTPRYVLMDSWYTSIENLKAIARKGWYWIGELKKNRQVSVVQGNYCSVSDLDWTSTQVHKVWLKAYGWIVVSRIVAPNGDSAYIATNDCSLADSESLEQHYASRWTIETFHRGIKQCTGIERCPSRRERSQRNHILCSFLVFLRLECERIQTAVSWYEQKLSITRPAVRAYLASNA